LPLIETEDVTAIESITPHCANGTGNVTIKECVEAWKGKFVMIGGLNSVALITYSMKELEKTIEQTLEDIGEYRHRYIIQNGDSLPPKVELEKLQFVIKKAKEYKID
jgi:uroporphyrinogen-III decarboxylase